MRLPTKYAIALTAALGLIMAVLDNTIVNVALVPMATALNADLGAIQWVVTSYFLAVAAVIPVSGYFSNRFGIKRMFIICLALFTTGSLLCGMAQNEVALIIFRIIQGIGGGALFPLSQAIAFGAFPQEERATASAVVAVPVLLAPTFGPTLGGWLTDAFGWEYIFLINIPIGMLAIVLAWRVFPPGTLTGSRRQAGFDYTGLILSTLGVLTVVYAFTLVSETQPGTQTALNPQGMVYGWGYWLVWVLLGIGLTLLTVFAIYELRFSRDPVLDLRLFRQYAFLVTSLITWLIAIVIFGSLLMIPIFLQQVRSPQLSALDAGLAMMPMGLAAAITVSFGGWLYYRIGVRNLAIIGSISLIISSWQLAHLLPTTNGRDLMPWLAMRGIGFGCVLMPAQTLALEKIHGPALPKASALFNATRQIFASIGIALFVTLFVQRTAYHTQTLQAQLPQDLIAGGAGDNPALQAARERLLAQAGTAGINDVFLLVTAGTVLLLLLSFALPGRSRPASTEATDSDMPTQPALSAES